MSNEKNGKESEESLRWVRVTSKLEFYGYHTFRVIPFRTHLFGCRICDSYRLLEIVNLYLANTAECRLSEE